MAMTFDAAQAITDEAQRFEAALAGTDPTAPVPSCPDWTADDLLWHLTTVHSFWSAILRDNVRDDAGMQAVEAAAPQRPASREEMLAKRRFATRDLVEQLAVLDDEEPRWSWWPADQTVGFTRRMQVAEALIHRVDAELTAGGPISPIVPERAAHAVDNVIDVMHAWRPEDATIEPIGLVRFVAEDDPWRADAEIVRFRGTSPWTGDAFEGIALSRSTTDSISGSGAQVEVRGRLQELATWMWARPGTVGQVGDTTVRVALEQMLASGIN